MDECLEIVGNNGKFQKNILYICILASLLTTIYTLMISFLTKPSDFFVIDKTKLNPNPVHVTYSKEICDSSKYDINRLLNR